MCKTAKRRPGGIMMLLISWGRWGVKCRFLTLTAAADAVAVVGRRGPFRKVGQVTV